MTSDSEPVTCCFCGLPAGYRKRTEDAAESAPVYCCLGCRIAANLTSGSARDNDQADVPAIQNRWALTRLGLGVFFAMNVMVFTLVLWSWNVNPIATESSVTAYRETLRYACFLFATPVMILLGQPLLESCLDALERRQFTTDILLLLGVVAAFVYSMASLWLGFRDVYFEVSSMVLVAVTFGKWLEATAKQRASEAMRSLRQLLPRRARRMGTHGLESVPLEQLCLGDVVRVCEGERVPVDGTVQFGQSLIDEQMITGESLARRKRLGDSVFAGTNNLDGPLDIQVAKLPDQSTVAELVRSVEKALLTRSRAVRNADRWALTLMPLIATAAAAAFWFGWERGIADALMSAMAVVVIACPCALGIATPLAQWVAINTAAKQGILFRNGDALSNLARVGSIAFDKTGTLTDGDQCVEEVQIVPTHEDGQVAVMDVAKQLAESSSHIMSRAIAQWLVQSGRPTSSRDEAAMRRSQGVVSGVRNLAGRGIVGFFQQDGSPNRISVCLGNLSLMTESGMRVSSDVVAQIANDKKRSAVLLGWNGQVRAIFWLTDSLRPESASVLNQLKQLGLRVVVLTGDRRERAAWLESQLGVKTKGDLLPLEKLDQIRGLPGLVAMVGDGVNDAPALAAADVGIALDAGADVSRDAAQVCLMGNRLSQLPAAIRLARKTQRTVTFNLIWAFAYNLFGVGLAVVGRLNPIVAAVAMLGSSLFVLTNSLRLGVVGPEQIDERTDIGTPVTEVGGGVRTGPDPAERRNDSATRSETVEDRARRDDVAVGSDALGAR